MGGASDRTVRSLARLAASASTARTLNLISIWEKHGETEAYKTAPFFKSPILNRSIIVKHRLRAHERDLITDCNSAATKVLLPIDPTDLRAGARSFFVGQRGYEAILDEVAMGTSDDLRDHELLKLLDELPSLDPFLMRERLKKNGFAPARCYFDLTEGDNARMFDFVRQELTPLIGMSFSSADARLSDKTSKLAGKILDNASDGELEPLRIGMGVSKDVFEEGMFCWKGFIYYKWTLSDLLPQVRPVMKQIASIRPTGLIVDDEMAYIEGARARLTKAMVRACDTVRVTLKIYDDAYADLTLNGQPQSFRDFLLKAPALFYDLGERLGSVHHIVSFWRYRFPSNASLKVSSEELCDLLADFEASLCYEGDDALAA